MFGDNNYQLIWSGRQGFASVAKEANVPIIPVFTKNSREAFRCLPLFQEFFRKIYDQYKIPLFLPYGGLPVKMTTIIGEPIYFLPEMSVTEIAELVIYLFFIFFFILKWKKINLIQICFCIQPFFLKKRRPKK